VIDRRAFLESGAALSATSVTGGSLLSRIAGATGNHLIAATIVIDRRFPEARVTGLAARAAGIRVAEVDGDMSRLWYSEFDLRWRRKPMTLAGVTAPEGLFVLETLANDRQMRVVFRGVHTTRGDGHELHRFRGPDNVVSALATSVPLWGTAVCAAFNTCPADPAPVFAADLSLPALESGGGFQAAGRELVTWIIAPRGTATPVARG